MTTTSEKPVKVPNRAMIYHQGLPVAVCPVAILEAESLQLIYGPFRAGARRPRSARRGGFGIKKSCALASRAGPKGGLC